jgi:hypothetical protein
VKPFLLALAASLLASAARADVVDLTQGSRRRQAGATGFSLRLEAGNSFAPYGYAGVAVGYLTESLFAFEGGAGAGFPGVQLGIAVRKLFGEGGSYIATEVAFAGNTKVPRGGTTDIVAPASTDRYIWTTFGLGFEQRTGRVQATAIVALAFTPSDQAAHFAVHGGLGYLF